MQLSKNSKIFIAGHNGMVGSAILRHLKKKNYKNIIVKSRKRLDLLNQEKTEKFLKKVKPDFVIIAAAKVGGILSNDIYRGEYIYQNLTIQNNVIKAAAEFNTKKFRSQKYFRF